MTLSLSYMQQQMYIIITSDIYRWDRITKPFSKDISSTVFTLFVFRIFCSARTPERGLLILLMFLQPCMEAKKNKYWTDWKIFPADYLILYLANIRNFFPLTILRNFFFQFPWHIYLFCLNVKVKDVFPLSK